MSDEQVGTKKAKLKTKWTYRNITRLFSSTNQTENLLNKGKRILISDLGVMLRERKSA